MAPDPSDQENQKAFLDELIGARLLIASGVPGVYGRSGLFEHIIDRIGDLVSRIGKDDGAEVMRFPPVLPRMHFEKSEYLKSFPQLAGTVHSFAGDDRAHLALLHKLESGEDWTAGLPRTDVVLTPAACYPIYPAITGMLPAEGKLVDVLSYCFRHEPSGDPARMQSFRQREYVRIATPEQVRAWRNVWLERAQQMVRDLGLPGRAEIANDPFFGRGGKMLAVNQRDQELKFEIVIPVCSTEKPTACISLNYHQDHFGTLFGIRTSDGAVAHTSCIGFGMERLTLALLKTHGLTVGSWPAAVREALQV